MEEAVVLEVSSLRSAVEMDGVDFGWGVGGGSVILER
jgi:hypothetical protein